MKKVILFLICTIQASTGFSQVLDVSNSQVQAALANSQVEGNPLANFFQKRTPMMDILFAQVKDDDGITTQYVGAEIGSAYENVDFKPGTIYYNGDKLGNVYYRLNAFNNEIELKKSNLEEEKELALVKNEEIRLVTPKSELLYRSFLDSKGNEEEGYLALLAKGEKYLVYKRLYKKFTPPKPAENSMVVATPSRFTDYTAYYYKEVNGEAIKEIPLKTNKFLKILPNENALELKKFLKENDFKLGEEKDLINIFKHLNEQEK